MRLTKVAIGRGCHQAALKEACGMMIHKPGKDDYTPLKANRSITLLSCMGTVVKIVLTELLSTEAETTGRLSDGQI